MRAAFTVLPVKVRAWAGALACAGLLAACEPPVSLPPEPRITGVTLVTDGESGLLVLGFEDGDGNFGLQQSDTTGSFCPGCPYHHNVFCTYQEWRDGTWTTIDLDPELGQVPFHYRAPLVAPTGQNKAQRGTISIDLEPRYYLTSAWDTLRFAVHIVDRELQSSDTVVTVAVTKP